MKDCIFCQVAKGLSPSWKVYKNEKVYAFLDINPNAKGHTLCIPKREVDKLFDLDETTYVELLKFSRNVAKAIRKTIDCKRVGMTVIGLEVPHVHVHLIPLTTMEDARFISKVTLSPEEFQTIAQQINANLEEV